ncbi:ferrochelatase [Phenylobacterium sp.]|uniref:ferrochelatase n=1 Tax=Phenylobacterium sp. TaxID=1871053 RepID=UPI002E380C81|nr:ferrochelatase [Phenylobacterium sp.]HEX2560011.1 ferrochelatase [Phenylobacterium sp.]
MTRLAVVLFNLGGPDGPEAVRPFLFNLFRDRAIIGLPAVLRYPIAAWISRTRETRAKANYAIMGGASPLLPETQAQARALEAELMVRAPGVETRAFIAMRYWRPLAAETAREVAAFAPDEIVLLPLYPQYSTTTTGSSVKDWLAAYDGPGRTRTVCCYPTANGLAAAHARLIERALEAAGSPRNLRLLFSAHGLPKKVVAAGDPYQAQVEATVQAVLAELGGELDHQVCYQSRVGPLEWLGPSTDAAIRQAAADGKGALVIPIAFVSDHVETLVELDHEYAAVAREVGCTPYLRVPALGVSADFIGALAEATLEAAGRDREGAAPFGPWLCPAQYGKCACRGRA